MSNLKALASQRQPLNSLVIPSVPQVNTDDLSPKTAQALLKFNTELVDWARNLQSALGAALYVVKEEKKT